MKIKARIKNLLSKLRRFRGALWWITIGTWISCLVTAILFHPSVYLVRIVEAIVLFYWVFCLAVAETKERRTWCIFFLILTIVWIFYL